MSVYLRAGKWKINIILGGVRINRNIPVKTRREALSIQKKLKTLYHKSLLGVEDDLHPQERTFGEYADVYLLLLGRLSHRAPMSFTTVITASISKSSGRISPYQAVLTIP